MPQTERKKKSGAGLWIGLSLGLLLCLVLAVTVKDGNGNTFFDRMSGSANDTPRTIDMSGGAEAPDAPADEPATGTTTTTTDTMAATTISTADPDGITEEEKTQIREVLLTYYRADNDERSAANIETLCDFFDFPAHYFGEDGVYRSRLEEIYTGSAIKHSYHNMDISAGNIRFGSKDANGRYRVDVPGMYSWSDDEGSHSRAVTNHLVLSPGYKIKSID